MYVRRKYVHLLFYVNILCLTDFYFYHIPLNVCFQIFKKYTIMSAKEELIQRAKLSEQVKDEIVMELMPVIGQLSSIKVQS